MAVLIMMPRLVDGRRGGSGWERRDPPQRLPRSQDVAREDSVVAISESDDPVRVASAVDVTGGILVS